jgi:ferredoxin
MTFAVNKHCVKHQYLGSVEVCRIARFYEGEVMLVIHPDECVDWDVCRLECPEEAIFLGGVPSPEKLPKLNSDYARMWTNITVKGALPPMHWSSTASQTSSTATFHTRWVRETKAYAPGSMTRAARASAQNVVDATLFRQATDGRLRSND